ncbi:PIN domain-containing protein [Candidatus Albibeggiatoa sp. nov. BB20]|uniref:PIN domain-containing protein n=1 Tax=Candidatus Albibeggiatoa sp. nov. BB20 TaxID=3162723 RepID=UPI0033653FD2
MQILISDANIIIDLEEGLLVEYWFKLPYQFHIPDILFSEELEQSHRHLLERGLKLSELTPQSIEYAIELNARYNDPSINDCFALVLAVQEKCPLLTGDKALRNAAKNENVDVKGTLWLVEQMIKQQLITVPQAKQAYQLMRNAGRRLPWNLVNQQFTKI